MPADDLHAVECRGTGDRVARLAPVAGGVISAVRYVGMESPPDAGGVRLSCVAAWVMLFTVVGWLL